MTDGATFQLRQVAIPAFAPTIINAIGHGAILPILALLARELGASVGQAAFAVALLGLGSLVASLPAGSLVARIGERRALVLAGIADAAAMVAAALAPDLVWLCVAVIASGMAWAVFLLARQGYLIKVAPVHLRARAMSTLGGSHRIGGFIGPMAGAGLLVWTGDLRSVFWLAAGMSLLAAAVVMAVPDLAASSAPGRGGGGAAPARATLRGVLREHRRVLVTVGSAVVVIGISRSLRLTVLPLWADHIGVSASVTSLVFGIAALVEIALFYPAGWTMDRFGRTVVAVPVVAAIGLGVVLMPLTGAVWSFTLMAVVMAIGNGMGSGIVMTLGADTSPEVGRAQYLGGWRLAGDIGTTAGPLLFSALVAVVHLAAACVLMGAACLLGATWVRYWVSQVERQRPGQRVRGAASSQV